MGKNRGAVWHGFTIRIGAQQPLRLITDYARAMTGKFFEKDFGDRKRDEPVWKSTQHSHVQLAPINELLHQRGLSEFPPNKAQPLEQSVLRLNDGIPVDAYTGVFA